MRSRFVIPAALLVTVAYVKGRLDANLFRSPGPPPVPVATPPVDPILWAEAEAADALSIAEAQTAASGTAVREAAPRDLSHLSEWLTTPTWGPVPPRRSRPRDAFDPATLAEWATDPACGPARTTKARAAFDPLRLAEWVTNPTWAPSRRTTTRDVLDAAALAEWATDPTWGAERRARTRDAFEAAALGEWIGHVAPTALPEMDGSPEAPPVPAAVAQPEAELVTGTETEVSPPEIESEIEIEIDESGRFSLGGWAAQQGHMALCGVTFRDRRGTPVDPGAIRLIPDALSNVGTGGLVVLADQGFAPDTEGFTILVAADGPGSFAVAGRYEVLAA